MTTNTECIIISPGRHPEQHYFSVRQILSSSNCMKFAQMKFLAPTTLNKPLSTRSNEGGTLVIYNHLLRWFLRNFSKTTPHMPCLSFGPMTPIWCPCITNNLSTQLMVSCISFCLYKYSRLQALRTNTNHSHRKVFEIQNSQHFS